MGVVVVGQVARDLVLRVDALPAAGGSSSVVERREVLGGKGANQAVGLAQLGQDVALVGVVGEDDAGDDVLAQARADGVDVRAVARRGSTALLVDVVDAPGSRRLLEHVPPEALLTPGDVDAVRPLLAAAGALLLQLQQPAEALVAAAASAGEGACVVLDGAVEDDHARERLLARADVVRANAQEAELLVGEPASDVDGAARAARQVLARGPRLVAFAVEDVGDLVVWDGGQELVPHSGEVVDPTGAGDAFVAGLVAALRRQADPRQAARVAAACARSTVGRLGGRPDLTGVRLPGVQSATPSRPSAGSSSSSS